MDRFPFIAIEGVIGVGKTTLARMLAPDLGCETLLEVFEENPFLSDFYADRARYAFQTQIFFLLSRYRQQHQAVPNALARGALFSDYTFAKDSLFAHLNLSGDELTVYEKLHRALAEKIPAPDLLVYLRADLDTLLEGSALVSKPDREEDFLWSQVADRPGLKQVVDMEAVFKHLSTSLQRELDFRQEIENIGRMQMVLADYDQLAVPSVYRELSTGRLLVMESPRATTITPSHSLVPDIIDR